MSSTNLSTVEVEVEAKAAVEEVENELRSQSKIVPIISKMLESWNHG